MNQQHKIGNLMKKNKGRIGRGMIIPFKSHKKQNSIDSEKEEHQMMKQMGTMRIGRGKELTKLKPLKFNY
jgi:hypothetical protein